MIDFHANLVGQDPHFLDPHHLNFQLQKDSPAFAQGFTRISYEQIGLRRDGQLVPRRPYVRAYLEVFSEPMVAAKGPSIPGKVMLVVENIGSCPTAGQITVSAVTLGALRFNDAKQYPYSLQPGRSITKILICDGHTGFTGSTLELAASDPAVAVIPIFLPIHQQ